MILTREILEQGKSANGGWSKKQLQCFGVTLKKGWMRKIIGKHFPALTIERFLSLKDRHLPRRTEQDLDKEFRRVTKGI